MGAPQNLLRAKLEDGLGEERAVTHRLNQPIG